MSQPQMVPALDARWRQRLRFASRIAGLIGVVLGGWSLWLAFSTVEMPEQIEALNDQRDNAAEAADELPDWIAEKPRLPKSVVQITDVAAATDESSESTVEPAAYLSANDAPTNAIEMAGYSTDANEAPVASAAWLTGEIEDANSENRPELPREAEGVPAWKRTTKSLKATLHTTRPAAQR